MSLTTLIKGKILGTVISKMAASEPRTTIGGFILASIMAANVDYGKVFQGDPQQLGLLIAAPIVAVLLYYTNHSKLVAAPAPLAPPATAKQEGQE